MASFSSIGIGLGGNVDVNGLIKASVDAVKIPITKTGGLSQQAALTSAKVSAFGQFKSLISTLSDAASKLASVTGWNGVSATSSKSDAVSVSAVGGAAATSFNVQVKNLAKAQSSISAALSPAGLPVGEGTLTFKVGKWDSGAFPPGATNGIDIDVSATDKLADIASKINGSQAGVTATILTDATGERLMLRSKTTGEDAGYEMTVAGSAGLSRLAASATGATTEYAQDAKATVNGVVVTSASNSFANTVAGVTFTALRVTTVDENVAITVSKDNSGVQKNAEAFVAAYNAINQALSDVTKYDAGTKTAGLLQGDSAAVTLQNTLRMALQSVNGSGALRNLSSVGIVSDGGLGNLSPTGDLKLDITKFNKAMEKPDDVKAFFRGPEGGSVEDGFAGKFKSFTSKLLASDGFFASKAKIYENSLKLNAKDVETINDRADRLEVSLKARYSALDTKMSSLNALNAYISQQVTTWNKSS